MKNRAIFLDRDGVINPLIYFKEKGIIDSPFSAKLFRLLPGVALAIKRLNKLGFKVFVVSNQPGIAKNKYNLTEFKKINRKMFSLLQREGAILAGAYYCLHHPQAVNRQYKKRCECRKPKPGLLKQAAIEHDIDLQGSYMVGDNISDIKAGQSAGCKTIFIGLLKCDYCKQMQALKVKPDYIVKDLSVAVLKIEKSFY